MCTETYTGNTHTTCYHNRRPSRLESDILDTASFRLLSTSRSLVPALEPAHRQPAVQIERKSPLSATERRAERTICGRTSGTQIWTRTTADGFGRMNTWAIDKSASVGEQRARLGCGEPCIFT